ncbi:MAG: type III secretion system inner membrane ring subunit SctD [Candidatus Adiutrix sp.]|jgi:type III secretion system YscD/HrpQ family protein|nr:type III secretion system inner membrane ring subunit SctD [Candidatus Adiutrix sp.]
MTRAELRILSGPHLGAALELPEGVYLVGSADEADLILAADDTVAGRHLELTVRAGPTVSARPLEGEAALAGRPLPPEGGLIPPGEALSLGFTALAWRPKGESWGAITLAPLEFAGLARADADEKEEAPASAPAAEAGLDEPPAEAASDRPAEEPAAGCWTLWLGLAILVLLLGGLLLGGLGEGLDQTSAAERLNALFAQNGVEGVRAEPGPEALVIRGQAADDGEMALIARLAAAQPYRVRLEVRILADRLRAVRETMNNRGFFPEVGVLPDGRLRLAVYMRDAQVEDQVFEDLEKDIKGLAEAERRVVHAPEIAPALTRELRLAGLDRVAPVFLEGRVRLPFQPTAEERRRLNLALEKVRQAAGAPLAVQLASAAVLEASSETGTPASSAAPTESRLEVMSVNLGPLPFITLRDGQKFFIGGVLPGGAALAGIAADHLELTLGDKTTIHPLEDQP